MSGRPDGNANLQMVLRTECWGHQEDVRALCTAESGFISASRDRTAKVWAEHDAQAFESIISLVGHEDYVGAVAYIHAGKSAAYPQGAVITGSRDKTVIVWNPVTAQQICRFQGHKWQVTAVAVLPDDRIASASLDGTIRIWGAQGEVQVLEGHEGPVQCLLVLPDGSLLSGSNDKTIKVWHGTTCVRTLSGHTDTVRGLSLIPDLGFVSASHDGTLQIWTIAGEPIATLAGHTALVYSADATSDGLIASASEDNTARLWRADGTCLQVLEHPACVWDVTFLPNSDLVTGCADFAARVWTASADRTAPPETIKRFEEAIQARKAAKAGQGSGGLPEGLTLEDPLVLTQPGQRDGQTKVIKEGGGGVAYSWSAARQEWEKVGEVVSGPEAADNMAVGGKQLYGQTWDYVFDVDIEDGAPIKKLPVNRGENPYDAADRFLEQEGLPISYREQIVNFIVTNTHGGVTVPAGPSVNVDPFTGGGAYIPGSTATFGGPSSSSTQHPVVGGGFDPFTGGSSAAAPAVSAPASHIPAKTFVIFANVPNTEAIARKVRETSSQLASAPQLALSQEEGAAGCVLDQLLARAASAGVSQSTTPPSDQLALLAKMLRWPAGQLFPALDIARLLALDSAFCTTLAESAGTVANAAGGGIGGAFAAAMAEPQTVANQQTALRLACNTFWHAALRQWVASQASALVDGFSPCLQSGNKSVRLGVATFLLNCAVLQDDDLKAQVLSGLSEILSSSSEAEAPETIYRTLVAIGTVLHEDTMTTSIAVDLGIPQQIRDKQHAATGKVADAIQEVLQLF